jgi:hypothetical protein
MSSTKFKRQSPELMRQRFLWLNQVLIDPELPASAFKVAYRIGDGFNDIQRSGEAFESCKKIAVAIGMSEATVIDMVRRLHARGHLRIEWGQQGRGHQNNYWHILKPQSAEVNDEIKPQSAEAFDDEIKPQPAKIKPQPAKIKPQPATRKPQPAKENQDNNQEENQGENHAGARAAAPASFSSKEEVGAASSLHSPPDQQAAADFETFWSVYPKQRGKAAAKEQFKKALRKASAEEIITGARQYAADPERIAQSRESDQYTKYANNWLKEERWTDRPNGMTIDVHGNTVVTARSPWKRNGRDSNPMAVAEALISTGRFSRRPS